MYRHRWKQRETSCLSRVLFDLHKVPDETWKPMRVGACTFHVQVQVRVQ
uniref:Uncharacterized protein n=1 Tax=Arundo donax TaxID=35708 RepID=A0A0A8Z7I0_ARUDO